VDYPDLIRAVTAEDVRRVAATYLYEKNSVTGWLVPELSPPDDGARVADAKPEPLPIKRTVLPNGLIVLLLERRGLPVVSVQAAVRAGKSSEAADENGLSSFTGSLLDCGTRDFTKQQIAETEQQIAFLEQRIGQMAREVYQAGGVNSEMEVLLDSDDPGDFASRLETLRSIAQGNNNTLTDLDAAKAQLNVRLASLRLLEDEAEKAQAEAQKEVDAAAAAKAKADAAKLKIDELVAGRVSALRDAKERKQSVRRQYEQLKAEQDRIAAIARAAAAKAVSGTSGVPANIGPSGLAWPVTGAPVVQNVGPRIHPVYGYRSCHTGTDISAGQGAPIQAAADGVVVSIENGGPYGLHTVIQHGSGVSTMYAHQAGTSVSVGDKVKRGQVIGSVGSTGWVTGPHLHFEVHVNGTPYNPMGWFGGTKAPVRC